MGRTEGRTEGRREGTVLKNIAKKKLWEKYQHFFWNHYSNFGKFDLALTIHNERKWRKIAIKEELKKKKIELNISKDLENIKTIKLIFLNKIIKKIQK